MKTHEWLIMLLKSPLNSLLHPWDHLPVYDTLIDDIYSCEDAATQTWERAAGNTRSRGCALLILLQVWLEFLLLDFESRCPILYVSNAKNVKPYYL
jgi:hypothetical protein